MLYFQTPIIKKLSSQEKPTVENAKILAVKYLEKCKETRKLVTEDKNGIFVIKDLKSIQKEILSQQVKLPKYISCLLYTSDAADE